MYTASYILHCLLRGHCCCASCASCAHQLFPCTTLLTKSTQDGCPTVTLVLAISTKAARLTQYRFVRCGICLLCRCTPHALYRDTTQESGGGDTAAPVRSDAAAGDAPSSPPLRASSSTFCKNSMAPKTHAPLLFVQSSETARHATRAHTWPTDGLTGAGPGVRVWVVGGTVIFVEFDVPRLDRGQGMKSVFTAPCLLPATCCPSSALSFPPLVCVALARANQNLPRMGLDWSAPPGRAEFSPGLLPFTVWSKDDLAMMKRRHAVSLGGVLRKICVTRCKTHMAALCRWSAWPFSSKSIRLPYFSMD